MQRLERQPTTIIIMQVTCVSVGHGLTHPEAFYLKQVILRVQSALQPLVGGITYWFSQSIQYTRQMARAIGLIFACVSYAEARNRYRMDVRQSVRHTLALYQNG